ncbi:MAG: phosphoribosylaminoimidazolesuccinocarboxamide synthase [Erysipelotrichaceae bacterium]|nr:phosphoribosylaminoimidazolesuccinocarboxamide synthase [Erysipelotrichaceae bacterium]MCI9313084.1 phosphoribosylaminoimidazolesuccinocarboxamide synthase [Erysipelotrichaceae bacterium]
MDVSDIVVFEDGELRLDVTILSQIDTVWLSANQMADLFKRDEKTIRKHINNVFKENEADRDNNTQFLRVEGVKQRVPFYSLDIIISVGYRVKSKRGVYFRKWASKILKEYMIQGYAVNEKRMHALQKTVQVQSQIIAGISGIETEAVLKVIDQYISALEMLDSYDHQRLQKPSGKKCLVKLTYQDCCDLIKQMKFDTAVFGVEKESGKVEGILAAVYQEVFGQEVYPTLEEKAANLLYFMIKDHPFADGCKRISAALFLAFLHKNQSLFIGNTKIISDSALVAITLMIAESKPEEKEIMIALVMNFLQKENA